MTSLLLNHVDRVREDAKEGRRLNELPWATPPARWALSTDYYKLLFKPHSNLMKWTLWLYLFYRC